MTDHRAIALVALLAVAPAATATDSARPVAVSPGHPHRLSPIAGPCPTFSWGRVAGAESYELVVYRAGRDEEEMPPVLRATIDGRAGSWTPTLSRCLERGGRYAWSLRARRAEGPSEWSAAALFEVAAGPGPGELEEALALLRRHLPDGALGAGSEPARDPKPSRDEAEETDAGSDDREPTPPRARAGSGPAAFSVDGTVEAGSFRGDGSGLTAVQAAGLSCVGCVAGGEIRDGAVTAAKIGAGCATGQVLMRGAAAWECATLTAPGCTPGDEVGCYTGPPATRGVGECVAGARTCLGDSTWGACFDEVVPAAAEACDGLDNTCDGAIDDGDPTTLCPLTANATATACDTAACAVTGCELLWADADGDYANGCEAPAPGACLDGGVPRPIAAPAEGELVIQELLADPASPLADSDAEWFEVAAMADVDLNGLGIGTTFGTVIDTIDTADCQAAQGGDLLIFARSADPAVNGGLTPDATFGFSLVNGGGDLHLAHGGNLVDAVSWTAGDVASGRARNLPPALQDATANDDPASWCNVTADPGLLYSPGNYGSPGVGNGDCP